MSEDKDFKKRRMTNAFSNFFTENEDEFLLAYDICTAHYDNMATAMECADVGMFPGAIALVDNAITILKHAIDRKISRAKNSGVTLSGNDALRELVMIITVSVMAKKKFTTCDIGELMSSFNEYKHRKNE